MATKLALLAQTVKQYSPYIALTLAILLPLLAPGFVLTLDMVFTPTIPMPEQLSSSYLLYAVLHGLNVVLPADVLQKILLAGIFLLAGIGMHRLLGAMQRPLPSGIPWHLYAAGIFFAVNPFTYSRFMAGQFAVLLGYALLPWLLALLLQTKQRPGVRQGAKIGLLVAVIGIASIHTLGLVAVLVCSGFIAACILYGRHTLATLRPYRKTVATAAVLFIVLSSYWLIPLAIGEGSTAAAVSQFDSNDTAAFATRGDSPLAQGIHVLFLQGFWAEGRQLFTLPQTIQPLWGLIALSMLALVAYGWFKLWRQRPLMALALAIAAVLAGAVALGAGQPIALLAGFREPHKFVGLIGLAYGICLAYGGKHLLERWKSQDATKYALAAGALLLLPIVLTPTIFWGANGQLQASRYPSDWFAVNNQLRADRDTFRIVFLPWHHYMSYEFTGNRIIASPAHLFFDTPMVASTDPELRGAKALRSDHTAEQIGALLKSAEGTTTLGERMGRLNVKYILLVKEYDYKKNDVLQHQQDLKKMTETDTLVLYRNLAWRSHQ